MNNQHHDLIDLGTATVKTKGGPVGTDDHERGRILAAGLADD